MSSVTISSYKVGYVRVSTLEQNESLQRDALLHDGCSRLFVDRASGKLEHRPGLDQMLNHLRSGDTLVVWRLDRLGRSLRHLIDLIAELEHRGVAFKSLNESIDTTTPTGRLTFHVFASIAQFEKDLIRERTMAGLAAARARGRKGGRPTVWTDEKLRTAFELYDARKTDVAGIARILGLSRASVYRALADRDASAVSPNGLRLPPNGGQTEPQPGR